MGVLSSFAPSALGAVSQSSANAKYRQDRQNEVNRDQAQIAREFERTEAATNRKFNQTMAQNAHLYEVNDLVRAGLNPILSAGGAGASGGSSAMGRATAPQQDIFDPMSHILETAERGLNSALDVRQKKADIHLTGAQETVQSVVQQTQAALRDKYMSETKATAQDTKMKKLVEEQLKAESQLYKGKGGQWLRLYEKLFGTGGTSSIINKMNRGR